jgi:hypothetical protein
LGTFFVEPLLCLLEPVSPPPTAAQELGQLVASLGAVELVLGGIDAAGLGDDLLGELLIGADRRIGGVGGELRAVDGDHACLHEPRLGAEREHLAEDA